ncbi:Pkinase-domain-containing protein [Artomyces pyxidatus]|uniref:Pkinase-domain-containing protein n=1 Tax=Artomyces pyxidatus TaxID=48021 RepID=A0ACB8T3P1_9AGAM|nr:Pkinase-domain-containing protein [Artomyces pyxidatus]
MKDLRHFIHTIESRPELDTPFTSCGVDNMQRVSHGEWSDDVLEVTAGLGEGIGGMVQAVRDRRTGIAMARKTIVTREGPLKQLVRELSMITTLAHVNIIHFYGAYMSPSSSEVKVVMELCEGKSLEAVGERIRRRKGRVGEKVARVLADGILQGLAYLHSKRLIHRDIKPSNILFTRQGVVKLCDFGVSGELVQSVAGTFTGTVGYMAPERVLGRDYSIRADVWSAGLSILELVQNRFPYPADISAFDLVLYISENPPPQLEDEPNLHARWSDAMKDFLRLALTVDPAQRPIPRDMLLHSWITKVSKHKVDMTRWIAEVWSWDHDSSSSSPMST